MIEKIGHIRNPLSIIAIFAGIAEISGTVVLPFITPENQAQFIPFLIWFPFFLVGCFFYILYKKHRVLYAPSDYQDEANFVDMARTASPRHIEEKREMELREASSGDTEPLVPETQKSEDSGESPTELAGAEQQVKTLPSSDVLDRTTSVQSVHINSSQYGVLENWAISLVQADYKEPILRNVRLPGNSDYIFDGIIPADANTTVIEVKLLRAKTSLTVVRRWASELRNALSNVYDDIKSPGKFEIVMPLLLVDGKPAHYDRVIEVLSHGLTGYQLTVMPMDAQAFVSKAGLVLNR